MKVFTTVEGLRAELTELRSAGQTIEFVPTMGALHQGHLSLIQRARRDGGVVVVSIFVNPTQFGESEDFETYPRDLEADLATARGLGVEVVFAPDAAEMYPGGEIRTTVDPGPLGRILEGAHRPGHFTGVATVCAKLFNIVGPDRVYLGRKDAQQVAVLKQMVGDLNFAVELVPCPTVREKDGLAMSSRNRRLSPGQRREAPVIFRALQAASAAARAGERSSDRLLGVCRAVLDRHPSVRVQYLEVVDQLTFEPVDRVPPDALLVIAAQLGSVRLIDNTIVGTAERPEREGVR